MTGQAVCTVWSTCAGPRVQLKVFGVHHTQLYMCHCRFRFPTTATFRSCILWRLDSVLNKAESRADVKRTLHQKGFNKKLFPMYSCKSQDSSVPKSQSWECETFLSQNCQRIPSAIVDALSVQNCSGFSTATVTECRVLFAKNRDPNRAISSLAIGESWVLLCWDVEISLGSRKT